MVVVVVTVVVGGGRVLVVPHGYVLLVVVVLPRPRGDRETHGFSDVCLVNCPLLELFFSFLKR